MAAESTEVLNTGPDIGRGIPYLSANVIRYYQVTYRAAGQENSAGSTQGARFEEESGAALRVLYTDTSVVPSPEWKAASCGGSGMLTVAANPAVLFYRDPGGWSLFFVYPADYHQTCAFATVFLRRFSYFLGITQNSALSSFPAVLQIP